MVLYHLVYQRKKSSFDMSVEAALLLCEINFKLDRAVIRTEDIGVDGCLF